MPCPPAAEKEVDMGERDSPDTARWQRRWYQFSLRTALVVTFVCSVLMSASVLIWARLQRGNVEGMVTVDGLALKRGTITFVHASGTASQSYVAPIQGGQYAFKQRVPSGQYRVEIRAPQGPTGRAIETLPSCYNANTELMIEIMPGQNTFDLELAVGSAGSGQMQDLAAPAQPGD
jgi:hypothetical protein